jgi:hypothetical protein
MTLESPDTVSPLLAADILDEINEFTAEFALLD